MNEIKVIVPRNEVVLINSDGNPLFVEPLKENEKIVDVGRFNDFVKPLYDEVLKDFKESAMQEEIAKHRPAPYPKETPIEETLAREIISLQNELFELKNSIQLTTR